ncbi:hypothetical protein BDZ97DRAFT_1912888 [Flammula alnicola]|nr:hypothetical protein BDZ97DRAFT_1912888 [Flammula alnicola]
MPSLHSVPPPGEDHDQPEPLSKLVPTKPYINDGSGYHGHFHWQAAPSSPVLSEHESSIKYLLRDYFACQEDADTKNKVEIAEKLHFVINSLSTMDQALKTVTLTLGWMETTLEHSLSLQEQSLAGQTTLLASIEKTQDAILSFFVEVIQEWEDDFMQYKSIYVKLMDQYKLVDTLELKGNQTASLYDLLQFKDWPTSEFLIPDKSHCPPAAQTAAGSMSTSNPG